MFPIISTALLLTGVAVSEPIDSFPLPSVPPTLTSPTDRAEVVVEAFFDQAILPEQPSLGLETAIANFSTVASLASEEAQRRAMTTLISRADNEAKLTTLRSEMEQYLFSSDSPYLNLDLFTLFLEADKPSLRRDGLLMLTSPNRTGSDAADIPILTTRGERTTLSQLVREGQELLLIFFDPECEHCIEFTRRLASNSELASAKKGATMSVVAVYPGGELPEVPDYFPSEWTVATDIDGAISENDLYFFPSFPEAYILTGPKLKVKARGTRLIGQMYE